MENLGFKEGFGKTKNVNRQKSQTRSIVSDDESFPLNITPKPLNVRPRLHLDVEALREQGIDYLEAGPSPDADETVFSVYSSFEFVEETVESSIQICDEVIRSNLIGQMKALGHSHLDILNDIEHGNVSADSIKESLSIAITLDKNIAFLWSAYLKRWDLLEALLDCGADKNYSDANGYTALHLASFSGCLASISFLIENGMDVNVRTKCYTPLHFAAFGKTPEVAKMLIINGAKISNSVCIDDKPACELSSDVSLLHCAVRARASECLELFIEAGADVNAVWGNGTNAIHLAADLGQTECLEILLNSPKADVNIKIGLQEKESTALHLAADEGNSECVHLLLAKGADATLTNHRGYTPLHLASRTSNFECVALLLEGGADPNAIDFDQRTPLHAALGKSDNTLDILETLIAHGADVNQKDIYGFTSLHLAALEGIPHCVELLIFHGANVTSKSKRGTIALSVIARKTPSSLPMINQKLDEDITLKQQEDSFSEIEVDMDFRALMLQCHPREISYLNDFVDVGQKDILLHPLCNAFLYLKWRKIRKYFILRLIFCFTYVLLLTLYILSALAHNCYNSDMEIDETTHEQELCQKQSLLGDMLRINPFVIGMQWWTLVVITSVEILRKLYGITGYTSVKKYVTQIENIFEWYVIFSVFIVSHVYTNRTYTWQNHVGAFAVLVSWTNMMFMVGQLPALDAYVAMYMTVQSQFAKLFAAFFCLLIGFTLSFCVIYGDSSAFANPLIGFITVLVMMTGEQDPEILINDPDGRDPPILLELSGQFTFIVFMFFVTIVLMNLLLGIAIDDIQALKETADLAKLERLTKLISFIETALFNGWLPKWLKSWLHHTALVSPEDFELKLSVRPLSPEEKKLPREILKDAYDLAKSRKNVAHIITDKRSNYFSHKDRSENASTKSGDSGHGFEEDNLSLLSDLVDERARKIDLLTREVKELKEALQQNQKGMDQLKIILANRQNSVLEIAAMQVDIRML